MTEAQLEAMRDSFRRAEAVRQFDKSPLFYDHFFRRAPDKRAMFRDDLSGQGMKFMSTLRAVVAALSDPDALERSLRPLAEGHAAMGVRPADFEPMQEALIDTFKDVLGADFTAEMETAWRAGFVVIARKMQELGRR